MDCGNILLKKNISCNFLDLIRITTFLVSSVVWNNAFKYESYTLLKT